MSNELTRVQNSQPVPFDYFNNEQFATMQRICTMFANSELVPDMYKITEKNPKEKAIANCMIAFEIAQRINASALMVMQNMYIVYGRPSWSSKFLVATVNTCGRFSQLKYKFESLGKVGMVEQFNGESIENLQCIAYTNPIDKPEEILESSPVTVFMAIQQGWWTKNGSKWPVMTKKMLMYRAASFWTNEYAPEISMGMKTEEEVHDIEDIPFEEVKNKVGGINGAANKTPLKFEIPAEGNPNDKGSSQSTDEKSFGSVKEENKAEQPAVVTESNPI